MSYKVEMCDETNLQDRLNGAITLGPIPMNGLALDGLTLIFVSPAQTVTFVGVGLISPKDVLAAILAVTGVKGEIRAKSGSYPSGPRESMVTISLWHSAGLTLDKDGTANTALRVSAVADTTLLPIASANVVSISNGAQPGHYLLVYSVP